MDELVILRVAVVVGVVRIGDGRQRLQLRGQRKSIGMIEIVVRLRILVLISHGAVLMPLPTQFATMFHADLRFMLHVEYVIGIVGDGRSCIAVDSVLRSPLNIIPVIRVGMGKDYLPQFGIRIRKGRVA